MDSPDPELRCGCDVQPHIQQATCSMLCGDAPRTHQHLAQAVRCVMEYEPADTTDTVRMSVLSMIQLTHLLCRTCGHDTRALCVVLDVILNRLAAVPPSSPADSVPGFPFALHLMSLCDQCCYIPLDRCS